MCSFHSKCCSYSWSRYNIPSAVLQNSHFEQIMRHYAATNNTEFLTIIKYKHPHMSRPVFPIIKSKTFMLYQKSRNQILKIQYTTNV